jgi:hypothetical protein
MHKDWNWDKILGWGTVITIFVGCSLIGVVYLIFKFGYEVFN